MDSNFCISSYGYNFCSQRGKNPVIIINLWTMFNHFELSDSIEVECVGKRINMVKVKFELFLGKLVNHGATLMFVFKKTRLRELDFIINEENDYKRTQKFLHEMKNSNYTSDVVNYVEGLYNRKLSRNEIVSIGLVQSAQKFGKLCGVMDSSIKQSTHDDDLATKEDALAILGTDSYYFFYKGINYYLLNGINWICL